MTSTWKVLNPDHFPGLEGEIDFLCDDSDVVASTGRVIPIPDGQWRSLGCHFDYTYWPDRERFVQLDRAIQCTAVED